MILFDRLVPAVVDARGGAPGTRETDLLASDRLVGQADAILLTGGSAFGLAAAEGVMQYLRERGRGFATAAGPVPIVPAAVIYDLAIGDAVWPTAEAGYTACLSARPIAESGSGQIGAGRGATIRKLWPGKPTKLGGFGWSKTQVSSVADVYAIAVVNAVGDVVNGDWVDDRADLIMASPTEMDERSATTLVTVVVDGDCDHRALRRIAVSAHDAMARAIVPCHTLWDGDLVFAAQTGPSIDVPQEGVLRMTIAAELAVEKAIRSALHPS